MARCQKKENVCSQKREKLINDFQELIDCMKIEPSEKPVAGKITVRKQLVCVPCPGGDTKKNERDNDECEDDSWKKDRYKSRELKGGVLISGCDCLRRNGLQHDCPRSLCMGRPPCLVKPWPDCIPSGGSGLKGYDQVRVSKYPYKPAPCPPPDFPGPEEYGCHKAEVDCPKCVPVLMCRPGEEWECLEGKCPSNPPTTQSNMQSESQQQQQCPLGRMMQLQECPMREQCPEQARLPTNVIGQEIICQSERNTIQSAREDQLREMQRAIGCPNKEPHQRPGYETPQRLCRASEPQPIQQTAHSSSRNGNGSGSGRCPIMSSEKHCDPPTHILKRPAYENLPAPPVSDEEYVAMPIYCVPVSNSASCPSQNEVPAKPPGPMLTKRGHNFAPAVYRSPPRLTIDDWMCQLPCPEKEQPMCVECYGEPCYWHKPVPPLKRFTADDLHGQW